MLTVDDRLPGCASRGRVAKEIPGGVSRVFRGISCGCGAERGCAEVVLLEKNDCTIGFSFGSGSPRENTSGSMIFASSIGEFGMVLGSLSTGAEFAGKRVDGSSFDLDDSKELDEAGGAYKLSLWTGTDPISLGGEGSSFGLDDSKELVADGGAYKSSLRLGDDGCFGAPPKGEKLFFTCAAPFGTPGAAGHGEVL